MKKTLILSFSALLLCTGCTNTMALFSQHASKFGHMVQTKVSHYLYGDSDESRLVSSTAEFYGTSNEEFIPLDINEIDISSLESFTPQPSSTPGALGSALPGIDSFVSPSGPLAELFKRIHFDTDQFALNSPNDKVKLQKIAAYLKKHPSTYVFIEGHCDQRGGEAYNLALGTKRASAVRQLLVHYGVNPNQLYSISYGKEKPLSLGSSQESYAKNRRACFKIYTKGS
jgi:peptidoglycan-associated lipoprotein